MESINFERFSLPQRWSFVFSSGLHTFFGQMLLRWKCWLMDFALLLAPVNMPIVRARSKWSTAMWTNFIDWTQTAFIHRSIHQWRLSRWNSGRIGSCWCQSTLWEFWWCVGIYARNLFGKLTKNLVWNFKMFPEFLLSLLFVLLVSRCLPI